MNPRQRQGLLLVVIAAIGLVAVFVLIANYVSNIHKQVGPKIDVLVLSAPATAYQAITTNMVQQVSIPQKWAPAKAMHGFGDTEGLVAGVDLPSGTELQQGMLIQAPALVPGRREIAILVDAETGVAGEVNPGSVVDIVATFQAPNQSTTHPGHNSARVLVTHARILNVGQPTMQSGSSTGSSRALSSNQVVPVTFSLTPQQVLKVTFAESFAQKVRLALVAPAEVTPPPNQPLLYAPGL